MRAGRPGPADRAKFFLRRFAPRVRPQNFLNLLRPADASESHLRLSPRACKYFSAPPQFCITPTQRCRRPYPIVCTRTIGGWEHTASTAHETGRLIHGTAAAVPPPPHAAGPWMHELVAQHNGVQASPPVTSTPPVAADTTAAFQAERAPSTTTVPTADATLVVASTTSGAVALAPSNASPAAALAASPTTGAAARMPSAMTGAAALAPSSASPAAARRPSPTTGAAARMPSAMTGAAAVPASTAA